MLGWLFSLFGRGSGHRRRAQHLASVVRHELTRLKISARTAAGDFQTVQFSEPLLLTADELWLPIDLTRLPLGKSTTDLRSDEVLTSLSDRCNAPVRFDQLSTGKLCYVVRMAGSEFPSVFPIGKFELPADAPALAIPLGIDAKGDHRWVDLRSLPMLLVVGATGNGKSNFMHAMLSTWVSRNTPADIELWLADHKGGVELGLYKSLMGSKAKQGIVRRFSNRAEDTIGLLELALQELERRLKLLADAGANNLADYGKQTGLYIRPLVLVIDEIFFLMLNKTRIDPGGGGGKGYTIAAWAENLLAKIASSGRAPGVHLAIATQKTGKDVLTSLITANFESRVVFSLADQYQSIYVLGNGSAAAKAGKDAKDAGGLPTGRAFFRGEAGATSELQTPLITADQVRLIVSRIRRYGAGGGLGAADEAQRFANDAKLLLKVSSDYFGGNFARSKMLLHESVRGVITADRFNEIAQKLERDGVLQSGGPKKPRRVAPGFIGRPALLDVLYGLEGSQTEQTISDSEQTVSKNEPATNEHVDTVLMQQDAVNDTTVVLENTVYGLDVDPGAAMESSESMPSAESAPDVPLGGPWLAVIEDLEKLRNTPPANSA